MSLHSPRECITGIRKLKDKILVEQKCVELWKNGGRALLERIDKVHEGWCNWAEEWKREPNAFRDSIFLALR